MTAYIVSSGHTSSGITLKNGDSLIVDSGGHVISTVVRGGGSELTVESGGTASGTKLQIGGVIDDLGIRYVPGGTAKFNSKTDVLTVTEGGTSVTLSLAGSYGTRAKFELTDDKIGGTEITLTAGGAAVLTAKDLAALTAPPIGGLTVPGMAGYAAGFSTTDIAGMTSGQPSALTLALKTS